MPERRLVVIDPAGLHARPAARFVQVASRFKSTVTIRLGDRTADAKSLIGVLGLTIRPATEIVLVTDGPDADAALDALAAELGPYLSSATTEAASPSSTALAAEPDPA
jgi:phosphotransferase system HPr (HPr) family protein